MNQDSSNTLNTVTCILAIGAAMAPFVLAFLVLQMTKYFTPRSEFTALKEQLGREHVENKEAIDEVRGDIKTILQMKIKEQR